MFLVGLTGGIASGKSLVSDAFAKLGVPVIDADVLARDVVAPGSIGLQQLEQEFGASILTSDKELDRAALRDIIFSNPDHRKTVDGLLHPLIRERADQQIQDAADAGHPYAINAIPLLVETAQQARFDRVLVVDVPTQVQMTRLIQRDGGSKEKASAILDAQATRRERLAVADDVIDNSGSKEETLMRVAELHASYLVMASG